MSIPRAFILAALLVLALASRPPVLEAAADFPVLITVEGNRIVDESGRRLVLRGLDPIDPVMHKYNHDPTDGPWGDAYFAEMAAWGAQIIRLSVHPSAWRQHGETGTFAALDEAIQWSADVGMYTYIDYHSIGFPPHERYQSGYETSKGEILSFWDAISTRYAGDRRVAFYEIFNEPTGSEGYTLGDWLAWREFAEEVIDTIRANDAETSVIVGGLQWAYDLSYAMDNPIRRENVVYATHPYPGSDWRVGWEEAFGRLSEDYPVFATEFGFGTEPGPHYYEGNHTGPTRYREAILDYLEGRDISWSPWCFSATWGPSLLEDIDGYIPSTSGSFFRDALLEKAADCGRYPCADQGAFVDVPPDHAYFQEIEALYQAGYIAGCSTDPPMYCPDATMTRAEGAVFTERGAHGAHLEPTPPQSQVFADVPLQAWFADWVGALWEDGFTAGCSVEPPLFCPERGYTRAEGAVFALRMKHRGDYLPPDPAGLFADVPLEAWYADWVEAAYHENLIEPCLLEPLSFCPSNPLTRAMAAYMTARAKHLTAVRAEVRP